MCSPLDRVDIIHVRVNIFLELRVVMHGHFNRNSILLGRDMNGFVNQFFPGFIQVFHEFTQSLFRVENFRLELVCVRINCSFIG